jgi:hypothetical protein
VQWYTRSMLRIALVLIMLAATAFAEGKRLEVKIGATLEVEVGNLIGVFCDQPKVVDAQLKTKKDQRGEVNVLVVKGVAAGTTQCRVGNDAIGGSKLFEVVVREK